MSDYYRMSDYYKQLDDRINKSAVDKENKENAAEDCELEQQLLLEDLFQAKYKEYFIDDVLDNMIRYHINGINTKNYSTAKEPRLFSFEIAATIGENIDGTKYAYLKRNYDNSDAIYLHEERYDKHGHNISYEIFADYICEVLNSSIYNLKDVKESEWKVSNYGTCIKKRKSISFRCTIEDLIFMHEQESFRYRYLYEGKEYLEMIGMLKDKKEEQQSDNKKLNITNSMK